MRRKCKPYNFFQPASAIFMILALLWLTVSAPFVFTSQQQLSEESREIAANSPIPDNEEETSNPFSNTTEEKNPSSNSFSEEYLHDHHISAYFFSAISQYHKCENADTYIAFHGELLVPPPNIA